MHCKQGQQLTALCELPLEPRWCFSALAQCIPQTCCRATPFLAETLRTSTFYQSPSSETVSASQGGINVSAQVG